MQYTYRHTHTYGSRHALILHGTLFSKRVNKNASFVHPIDVCMCVYACFLLSCSRHFISFIGFRQHYILHGTGLHLLSLHIRQAKVLLWWHKSLQFNLPNAYCFEMIALTKQGFKTFNPFTEKQVKIRIVKTSSIHPMNFVNWF